MSGIGEDQRAQGVYDPGELCLCIVVCFSAAELRRLAESMGAANDVAWGRGVNDAARDLVRHFDRRRDLPSLVARLREAKPLVEWPEPKEEAGASPFAPPPPLAPLPQAGPPPAPLANPGELSGPSGPPLIDPYLGKPTAPAETVIDAPTKRAPESSPAQASRAPSSGTSSQGFAWPGTHGDGSPEKPGAGRGIDPKILILVSAFTLLAALIAFIAGRAGAPSSSEAGATAGDKSGAKKGDTNEGDEPAEEPTTPAAILAYDIERALTNVARACELPVRGAPGEDILLRVFDRCGPQPAPIRPGAFDPLPPGPDSPAARPNEGNPGGATQRPAGNGRPAPQRPDSPPMNKAPGGECMGSCDSEQRSCNARCGKEPTQSTLYAEYTSCLGRCLSSASRCRLNCK